MYKHNTGARWHGLPRHIRPLFSFIPPMNTRHLIGAVLLSSLMLSCKKEDTPEPEPTTPTPIYMEPITDIDGNVYHTVKIGNQVWTVENLRTTHYRNGDPIPYVTDGYDWYTATTDGYCAYGNLPEEYAETYGYLYTWHAAMDSRKIAPEGWRIPSPQDFEALKIYLGDNCGNALKESGTLHWFSPNSGTNATGFNALPGGERYFMGSFQDMGHRLNLWTNLETNSGNARYAPLSHQLSSMSLYNDRKSTGFSIRLIKE